MTDTSQPLFLFGLGYCAQALAKDWDGPVHAFSRRAPPDRDQLQAETRGAHILTSAPPTKDGCPGLDVLGEFASDAASITYLSTTGVYGDLRGGWVFEDSPIKPQSERAKLRALAEQNWREAYPDVRIVRLPGIYGPGRSALDRIRAGQDKRVIKSGQVFSRAHVDDIASGLKALILADVRGVFHICDEEVAPPQDVAKFAAELLNVAPPPEVAIEDADLSPMALSFYGECKRVSNAKIKAVTGWRLKYPTYRKGLRAILASGG